MALNARARTRQRRAAIEQRPKFKTHEERLDDLPLHHRVALAICAGFYSKCACDRALDKPCCAGPEGNARHVIDIVRRHDMRRAAAKT